MNVKEFLIEKQVCPICNSKLSFETNAKLNISITNIIENNILSCKVKYIGKEILINIENNKILSDLNFAQNFLIYNKISFNMSCINEACSGSYIVNTLPITYEMKDSKIYSLKINSEILTININGIEYGLLNHHYSDFTELASLSGSIVTFPLINISNLKGKENIVNKIKTMLVFS